jgi:hypothetical protein
VFAIFANARSDFSGLSRSSCSISRRFSAPLKCRRMMLALMTAIALAL